MSKQVWLVVRRCALFALVLFMFWGCTSHPDIMATSVDNAKQQIDNKTFAGKVVLIDFWATWCGPCREAMPSVESIYNDYRDKGVQVIGISSDDVATVQNFEKSSTVDYPMYSDENGFTWTSFDIDAIPRIIVLNKQGAVVYSEVGAPIDDKAVRNAIDRALAG